MGWTKARAGRAIEAWQRGAARMAEDARDFEEGMMHSSGRTARGNNQKETHKQTPVETASSLSKCIKVFHIALQPQICLL